MVIGVTGGMGCGKSTVSNILSQMLNAPILDADKISHEAFSSGEILTKMCEFLGNDILDSNGNIDKTKVANIVFLDIAKLKKLNLLIHPFVMNTIRNRINELSNNYKYIIIDVPLPNDDFINLSDFVITVWADLEIRIDRLIKRSGFSRDAILARIKKQMPQEEYESLANKVIYNNGDLEELMNNLDEVLKKI